MLEQKIITRPLVLETILVLLTGFCVLYLIFDNRYFLFVGVAISIVSLIFPGAGRLITKLWYKIAYFLGMINTTLILTIFFFLLLFPMSLLARAFKRISLQLKKTDDPDGSYFLERNHQYSKDDLKHPF